MVYFNVTTFFVQSGFRNVMSSTKFVFSSVDFRLFGIFLCSMGTTWNKRDLSFGFVVNILPTIRLFLQNHVTQSFL